MDKDSNKQPQTRVERKRMERLRNQNENVENNEELTNDVAGGKDDYAKTDNLYSTEDKDRDDSTPSRLDRNQMDETKQDIDNDPSNLDQEKLADNQEQANNLNDGNKDSSKTIVSGPLASGPDEDNSISEENDNNISGSTDEIYQDETEDDPGYYDEYGREVRTNFDKVYIWIIGFLFLVLVALILFVVFSVGGNSNSESDTTTSVEETSEEMTSEQTTEDASGSSTDSETNQQSEPSSETNSENAEVQDSNSVPLDESYQVDYSDGSADRQEIASIASSVTGIPEVTMIEEWVGNAGPGRVEATVSNLNNPNERYVVTLQYGDGQWHAVDMQEG